MSDSASGERCDGLLEADKKQGKPEEHIHHDETPPDGGWGWVVCMGALMVNFLTVGQQNSAGVVYSALLNEYSSQRGETAWVASLASSTMYLFAAVATSLAERYGSRIVVIIASFVSASGLLASSFVTTLQPLYATYGVVWGLGSSLGLFPSIVILTKYFRKRLALASGIALAGAACGTLVYGPVIQFLTSKYGIAVTFRILACAQSVMLLCGLTFRPVGYEGGKRHKHTKKQIKHRSCIFKNRAYTIWVAALCVFMLVFLVPFVHLVRFAEDKGIIETKASLLTGYLAFGVLIGSIGFGLACDLPRFNRLKVCQLTLFLMALSTSLVTLATKYAWICVYTVAIGVLDGGYEMLVPVITRDLVGPRRVARAIGVLYCLMAFPKTLGPPIAGWLFDLSNDYNVSFYITGAVTILATAIMFLLNWVPSSDDRKEIVTESLEPYNDEPLSDDMCDGLEQNSKLKTFYSELPAQPYGSTIWLPIYFVESSGEYIYMEKLTAL